MEKNTEDCKCEDFQKCVEMLNLILDNEALPNEEKFVDEHLDNCAFCLRQYEVEKEVRSLIKRKLEKKEVPQDLLISIRSKIAMSY